MKIELLAGHTGQLDTLSSWYLSEWEPYYGINGPGNARADLESRCNRDCIPIGLVAMEGDTVCGTAALDLDATTKLTPSVVGLLVAPDYRRRGIATALLKSSEDLSQRLGYSRLYMSTTDLSELLRGMGWQEVGEVEFLNAQQGSIFVRRF